MKSLRPLRRLGLVALAATALLPLSARAQTRPAHDFTIAQVLSAPFPSSLVAAPAGGRVAWVYDDKGVRNVWVAERGASGAYASRPVTRFAGDDGFDMGELSWDGQGRTIAFTRGGTLEGGGPVNIMSLAGGPPPQTVWAASLDGSAPRQIGPGNSPAVSPRGDVVAYLSGGQIWTAPLAGGAPSQLIVDRGDASSLTWSPDGSKLAFVSTRTDHSFVGVYDLASHAIAWMSPSFDTDQAPEWSPDGRRIAFVRVPAGADGFFFERRTGQPWSIWTADAATGQGGQLWKANPGPGSVFHPVLSDRVLMWTAGDRIVFPWERTGWAHLWSIPATRGAPQELTPGAYEVFNTSLSPDRTRVAYSNNAAETDRWHLAEVSPTGGGLRVLTDGATIEDYPVFASDGQLFALHGTARDPMRPVHVASGAETDLAPGAVPAEFPVRQLVAPEPVVFTAADGLAVHAQLFLPPPGKRRAHGPAILFFHGGPIREMLLGWHPMDAYTFMYAMNQYLADEGYVVLSVNYRGGIGYGMDFREPINFGAGGASELNDILGAALYLRTRSDVDPARIGIYGASYGGLMTALGLARASNLIAAGVDYAGVHDWRAMLPALSQPGAPLGAAQLAFDSSALATVDKWRSPVLIVHADDDRNVPFSQSVELVTALRKHNIDVEELVIPNEIHDLLREQSWLTFFGATDDYFARHLMAASGKATQP
jgi:dipeptidyl aminopeptidase/acylaminoacyl peptidase